MVYTIASPDEYLAITGAGIKTLKIVKSAWVWPFQRCQRFSIQPHDYSMNLQAMTREKLQFLLPVVFTVGPDVNQRGAAASQAPRDTGHLEHNPEDHGDALMKYAMLLADAEREAKGASKGQHIENIVKGIIEGETRVLVSSMTMEEIFTEREEFKRRIFRNIQGELDQFGLKIYNANVKELRDAPQSSYFESLSRKAHEGAINQARIDVAEAQRKGNVGEAARQGEQNREIAKINAETAVQKTERDSEKAKAEATLATRKTAFNRDVNIAQIEATRATEARDEELRKEVETKRAQTELERLRATDVVKATIARESKQQAADAKNYEEQARSNAALYSEQKAADAHAYKVRIEAEARFLAAAKDAEALLVRQQKEAAGMSAMAGAYADLSHAFGGPAGLIQYLMIEKGVYTQLAKANADAVRGLNPKMTIWNTGAQAGSEQAGGAEGSMGGVNSIRNMYQMLPPLMSTINEQAGVVLPEWQFGKLAGQISDREVNGKPVNGLGAKAT
ncbi:putative Flotillin-like protein 1 [Hyaloscypha bicolor E]|uniref:Putative Flotillin-like protein 1 n=1 Tax=Hyaloscypha bicolor E TaxID=1095630 RepID=A0A2J6SV29_9HELO|nr:putative Flotillin-like protein 1 [Hyaloscypha bicolor E]PMD54627.1 putative Flotillin-like protein 1 [Hyaloscypha bicolor E]